jgi:hypothetical protein
MRPLIKTACQTVALVTALAQLIAAIAQLVSALQALP